MALNQSFQTPQYYPNVPIGTGYIPNSISNQNFPQPNTFGINQTTSLVWAMGEEGAKAYPVIPGNKVAIFDSTAPVVYIKEVAQDGRPLEMEIYDMVKREKLKTPQASSVDLSKYLTAEEVSELIAKTTRDEVEKAISEISLKPSKKKKGDDE